MGWSLSLVMALTVALTWFHNSSTHRVTVYSEQAEMRERAWEMVRLMNGINDRLYTHSAERTGGGTLPVTATGFRPVYGTRHIIAGQRVFVWQDDRPGLAGALADITHKTALAGRVKGRRLLNTTGQDTGISVPSVIPDSAFVYFN
ncbi:type IV pilus biogenesis protein PilM [Escherichia coli]